MKGDNIMIYTLKFADNSSLENITVNGDNFVSKSEVSKEFFTPERLARVEIIRTDTPSEDEMFTPDMSGTYENMKFIQLFHYVNNPGIEDGYYFVLRA